MKPVGNPLTNTISSLNDFSLPLSVYHNLYLPPGKILKGLSTFKTRGHLTGSNAQKNGTRERKVKDFCQTDSKRVLLFSDLFFSVDVKWEVYETRQSRERGEERRAAWGNSERGVER